MVIYSLHFAVPQVWQSKLRGVLGVRHTLSTLTCRIYAVTQQLEHLDKELAHVSAKADNALEAFTIAANPELSSKCLKAYEVHHKEMLTLIKQKAVLLEQKTVLITQETLEAQKVLEALLTGPRQLSLAAFLTVPLPPLKYSNSLSCSKTDSTFAAVPSSVTAWMTFTDDVVAFAASLDATKSVYPDPTFREEYKIMDEERVRSYIEHHVWDALERCPSPPPYSKHAFMPATAVGGLKGAPDWVALGYGAGTKPEVLTAIEAKTAFTMRVPVESSLAAQYAREKTRASVKEALHQTFGYMVSNQLRYGAIVTGEVYSFLERDDRAVRVADVWRGCDSAQGVTPQTAMYYVLHKAAESPGQRTIEMRTFLAQPTPSAVSRPVSSLVTAVRRPLQALKELVGFAQGAFEKGANQHDRKQGTNFSSKGVWKWEDLNIKYWIAQGRTGSVFGGVIGGIPVAVKVADYGHRPSALEEVQQEVEILNHLQDEQGRSVPRKIAQGYIADSTCYFVDTELLGETLLDAPPDELPALKELALMALERVHARGVLHNDVQPANFLRAGRGRVVLIDFAFAELSCDESARQAERAAVNYLECFLLPQ